jgi:amino acid adenylation domain-containing protein
MNEQTVQGVRLSPMQKRTWSLQTVSPVYFVQINISVTGRLDATRLADSIEWVIGRHDILRTGYVRQTNLLYPLQVVSENCSCRLEEAVGTPVAGFLFEEYSTNDTEGNSPLRPRLYNKGNDKYILVLQLPALAGDRVTIQKLAAEIVATYAGITESEEDAAGVIQYGQFAEWQLELMASPDEAAADFWQTASFEKGNEYSLPFANYETAGGVFKPAVTTVTPSAAACTGLMLLERNGIPADMMLMACFYMFLHRYLNAEETTIGFAVPGREYEELKDITGLLSTTLPVSIKPVAGETVIELAKRLEEQTQKVKEYGEYFSWPANVQNNSLPYFRSIYEYSEINTKSISVQGASFQTVEIISVTDQFDIKFSVQRDGDEFQVQLYYDTSVLSIGAAAVMAAQISDLLSGAVQAPGETAAAIAAQTAKPLPGEGDINTIETGAKNILDLFSEKVKLLGDGIAVQDDTISLTYKALNQQSTQLAAWLSSERNIKPGDIVAFCMERSANMIVTMLAILKTGAAYLPVDVKTPLARIQYMMEDSQAALLIADDSVLAAATVHNVFITDNTFWSELPFADTNASFQCKKCKADCKRAASLQSRCHEDTMNISSSATAYVIYTSGSTGKPKGVLVSHGSLVNYAHWFISRYAITGNDRTLLFSSVAFDLSYTALWSSLLGGAALYIHKEKEYLDPVEFITDLIDNRITFIKLTPSHFNLIARDPAFETNSKKYSLRLVVAGGEEIIAEDIAKYLAENPSTEFVNHYGPTEATIGILTKNIDKNNIRQFRQKTVLGRANANNQVYILHGDGQRLCAAGETGEIIVTGKGLATGYLNRKELTAEKFNKLPFVSDALCYRTGDLGRWMPDGTIEFLGRKDFQVKIRGYRVETGEIEEALLSFPDVEDASVQLLEDPKTKDKRLVAFLKTHGKINSVLLHEKLQTLLPEYMIPAEFIGITAFPLLPNGKMDRVAMQELASQSGARGSGVYVPPSNNTEKVIVGIWKEVLNGKDCGIKDNFFDLGGHSLKAAQLVSRIYKAFNKKIELRAIFDCPTVEQLARLLNTINKGKAYESIPVVPELEYYEVSHAQKRLWILSHFKKDKISYNSSSYYRIYGSLQTDILSAAFKELIERHESLRTTFTSIEGQPWQKINTVAKCGFRLETADVRGNENPSQAADELALSGYYDEFDLEAGPLLRAMAIQTGDEEWLLTCNIHHIVYDGWSLNILFNELLTIYNAFTENKENPLPPLAIQYKDYAAWHNAMISGEEEVYWLKKLANYPRLVSLPYDKIESPDEQLYARQNICLNEEDSAVLKEIAKNAGTTLSNLFLSLYGLFLNQVSGQNDIMIGIGHANRNHEDTEKLIGFFINMLVIRLRFSEEDTLDELVKQVAINSVEAFQHSNYPFDLLVEKLCVNRYADRQPILNVMYDFKNFHDIQVQEDMSLLETSLQIEQVRIGETIAAHDLILHVVDNEHTIVYYFEYKKECFLPGTVRNFYNIFNKLTQLFIRELSPLAMAGH